MNIEKHISELLFEHDCVIVPDFGGFVCNYSSANIHSAKHQFHPPSKKISFNCNLKNNDGLLANKVSQVEKISYSDSNRLILDYVEKLNKELTASKRFDFKNIGTFYLGEESTLLFEQDETANYLSDSFGLTAFYSPAIRREPIERKMEKKLKDKIIVPSKEKKEIIPAKRKTSRYLIASAAVLAIALLLWIPFQTGLLQHIDYSNMNPFVNKPTSLYQPSDITLPESDIKNENISTVLANDTLRYINILIDGQTPIVVQLQDDATTVVKTQNSKLKTRNYFHIIGGAFAVPKNAEKFQKKLVKLGYDAIIINKKNSSLQCVSYRSFVTREEALQALEKIRAVQSDVWLMLN
ncbi:MAG: SPOR domain-containing protein [Bacteroidota bacterium]